MGRTQNVFFNGVNSKGHPVQYGIPQRSILGPLLFVVYISMTLLKYFARCSIQCNVKVSTWCDNNHLLINLKKTNYVLVCSRQEKSV